jgi:hypothetical protein
MIPLLACATISTFAACADPEAPTTPDRHMRATPAFSSSGNDRVSIDKALDTLYVGQTTRYSASGTAVATGAQLYWGSSTPAVLEVTPAGAVRAVAPGLARVIVVPQTPDYPSAWMTVVVLPASAAQAAPSAPVIPVSEAPVAPVQPAQSTPRVAVNKALDTLVVGDTTRYVASGTAVASGAQLYWGSTAAGIVAVTPTGAVRAVAPGTARVVVVPQTPDYPTASLTVVVVASRAASLPASVTPLPAEPTTVTAPSAGTIAQAELPRSYVNTQLPTPTGRTIAVNAGGNLQAALDAAQPGDQVVLQAGATFVGNFYLRPKPGMSASQWITVRTSGTLPAAGTRVAPSHAAQMPKLLTPNAGAALLTEPGAQGWRLIGLEISATQSTTMNYFLVGFGDGNSTQYSLTQVPSRLVLDRSYVHGHPQLHVRRCVALNSAWSAVIDSYLAECHSNDGDSQAIMGWNGPGPFKIINNYLEGGHEVVGFGGPTPAVVGLIPSDIEIRRNHITRPLSWRGVWQAKNLFEMKNGQRVLLEGNVLENNWVDAQNGFAILLQALSDDNTAPQTRIWDITIRNNIIRNTPGGINLFSRVAYHGGAALPQPSARITITNNVVLLSAALGANGRMLQLLEDLHDVTFSRNTIAGLAPGDVQMGVLFDGLTFGPARRLRVTDNVFGGPAPVGHIVGNGTLKAVETLAKFAPDAVVTGNVFTGSTATYFPAGNLFPSTVLEAGLGALGSGDYRLSFGLSLLSQLAGRTPGVDAATLNAATAGVVR